GEGTGQETQAHHGCGKEESHSQEETSLGGWPASVGTAVPFFVTPKPTDNRMPTDKLITALGKAVAARWGELPVEVQQALFEAAIGSAGEGSREKLAVYLHGRHVRKVPSDTLGREVP